MEKKNDGGPAFPIYIEKIVPGNYARAHPGMSLRDWFAGQALRGILAWDAEMNNRSRTDVSTEPQIIAASCYNIADAMLAEREKKP